MDKPVYVHDFDFMFSVPSFEADPDKVTPDEIIEQFKRTIDNMESWEIFERSGHVQTIDPDTHMTTAKDWGLEHVEGMKFMYADEMIKTFGHLVKATPIDWDEFLDELRGLTYVESKGEGYLVQELQHDNA